MATWRVFDAGGDNNNCMILSVLACAPAELGGCSPERAREVRNELAAAIEGSAGTELGRQAHEAMRVLHAWKTANPAEFTADVSCPCADRCMHIEDEAECLEAAGEFVRGHYMLGAIELPFLKAWAASRGVHVVEVTSDSGGLDAETSAWIDAQLAQAPAGMKVAAIVSDSTHYQALLPPDPTHQPTRRDAKPTRPVRPVRTRGRPENAPVLPAYAPVLPAYAPVQPVNAPDPTSKTWFDVAFYVLAGAVVWTLVFRPVLYVRPS